MTTIEKVIESIKNKKSFILEAWAWSWKTYTLIETIRHIISIKWDSFYHTWEKIACITYTNVAKDEMIKRLWYSDIVEINTIHEFLWSLIWDYQVNLKKEIIELNNDLDWDKKIDDIESLLKSLTISYWKYWRRLKNWEIWHDDVINFSVKMFNKYPSLAKILIRKYPYLFIDEYQDTNKEIVNTFLEVLNWNQEKFLLWFFWDSMQKIYQNNTIWKLISDKLEKIEKLENFRSWKKIVKLVNNVREKKDWLKQVAMKDFDGEVNFYYSNSLDVEEKYKKTLEVLNWDFENNPSENKILVLTNKKIWEDLWFRNLIDIFEKRYSLNGNDRLKEADEPYINFLVTKIEKLIFYFNKKDYYNLFELFWDKDFKVNKITDKEKLKNLIIWLEKIRNNESIETVLKYIFNNNIFKKTDRISKFEEYLLESFSEQEKIERQEIANEFKNSILNLEYKEIIEYYKYRENMTPYSTQHWTKWAEYDNVLVIIDDSHRWYIYRWFDKLVSWEKLNKDQEKHLEAEERLLNLLYVSLSRAKHKLVVLYLSSLNANALNWWENVFWEENVIQL